MIQTRIGVLAIAAFTANPVLTPLPAITAFTVKT